MTEGSVSSRINNYLNPDAVAISGAQFGNLGRNVVIGPDQRRVDVSVSKRTRLTERTSLEFRTEAYNISNTPSFRNPERNIVNASFGQITEDSGRTASDSVRPQAEVLTGAPLDGCLRMESVSGESLRVLGLRSGTNTSRTQRHEAISITFVKRREACSVLTWRGATGQAASTF